MVLYRGFVTPQGLDLGIANALSLIVWLTVLIYWVAGLAFPGLASILGLMAPVLRALPPLMEMEALLFRILLAAFVLLTLTLVSGLFFSEQLFGKPLQFNHKTVFGILSWLIFGGLLAGHHLRGWRGRTAVMWTLSGFTALMLAYVGSKVVLELVLRRA